MNLYELYKINEEIVSCFDEETGEIFDLDKLNNLEMLLEDKIENIGLLIKNLSAYSSAVKAEEDNLRKTRQSTDRKVESAKKALTSFLNGQKFSTPKLSISFRRSESVEVTDIGRIIELDNCEDYLTYKQPEPNKTAIKNAIKNGIIIPGCSLVEKQNIQIK